jgi:hypothetical protein
MILFAVTLGTHMTLAFLEKGSVGNTMLGIGFMA